MRIALVNPEYPTPSGRDHGGIATYTYAMANALAEAGHTTWLFVREGTRPDALHPGIQVRQFGWEPPSDLIGRIQRRIGHTGTWEKGCAAALASLCAAVNASEGLDIVEIPEFGGLASAFTGRESFAKVIHFHTPSQLVDELNERHPDRDRRRQYRHETAGIRSGTAFRAPSSAMRSHIAERYGINTEKIRCIRYPYTRKSGEIARRTFADDNRIELLFAARIERRKGAAILTSALPDLLALDPRIHITFAGESATNEPQDWRAAMERILSREQRDRVWFLGPQNQEQLRLLYRKSDIFLMTSIFDNAPNTLLEAMDAAIPIVAADAPGVNELIAHSVNGILYPARDPAALAAAVQTMITNQDLRSACVRGGIEWLTKEHSPEQILRETISFYASQRTK